MTTEIKEKFEGKWKIYKQENYEAYLDASGLEPFERKLALTVKPVYKLTVDGDNITSKVKAGPIKNKITFRLGEEYEHTFMGDRYKGITTWQNGKLFSHITPIDSDKKAEQDTVREIIDGDLIVTLTARDVSAKQYMKKATSKK